MFKTEQRGTVASREKEGK